MYMYIYIYGHIQYSTYPLSVRWNSVMSCQVTLANYGVPQVKKVAEHCCKPW